MITLPHASLGIGLLSVVAVAVGAPLTDDDEAPATDPRTDEGLELFEARVRPALIEHCVECHSGEEPKGGLRLDSTEGIRHGAQGSPIFEPGAPDDSLMVEAVRHDDPFVAMPPSGKIPDTAIEAIERWVELGAPLPEAMVVDADATLRWCFRPPLDAPPPAVDGDASTDIDRFLLAALAEAGVEPSPRAEPGAWLRRATFDLTGLPPTPVEIEAFLTDVRNCGFASARDDVIDRLLASPAYAERWARRWLDLVRYAETKAHEFDFPIPNAFAYRDYVIRAFDADVPYDRFVTEFIAGDLVESPRLDPTGSFDESILGTGAWFLGEEVHSPVEPRGDQCDRIAHQVEVLSKSVLALGVACARCHDHKFDPISAEDFHGLAGFALSTAPRQVRYESDARNRAVAADWSALEETSQSLARAAVARALRAEAEALGDWLVEGLEFTPGIAHAFTLDDVRALDEAAARALGEGAPRQPIVVEDFEGEAFADCALAPWELTGDAFLDRPVRADDVPESQPGLRPRGLGCVNTYAGHPDAEGFSADKFEGTLTSAPFPIVRHHLHFLVDGGDLEGTRLELVDAESDEVLRTARGRKRNELEHRSFDVSDLQERMVRLRFVDAESGGWGQIGGDHFVLSDSAEASSLDQARTIEAWTELFASIGDPDGIAWIDAINRARGARRAPVALRALDADVPAGAPKSVELRGELLVDYTELAGSGWITNGPAFGNHPREAGEVVLDVDDATGEPRVAAILQRDAAVAHSTWRDLRVDPRSSTNRSSAIKWVQAGRTLASPRFRVPTKRVAHLVRGRGGAFVAIAGHKMLSGPLHMGAAKSFDTRGRWEWVVHDIHSAVGLEAHAELTSTGARPLEVALTVALEDGASPPALRDAEWLGERFEDQLGRDPEARVARLAALLRDAATLLLDGGVPGRALGDAERHSLMELAEFVASEVPRARASIAGDLASLTSRMAELRSRRVLESRLALAALDLEGQDEVILDRGQWRTPSRPAPRRSLAKLRAGDDPLVTTGAGSGRLALARDLLESPTGIVQRVWVNRTWHALFGRGLVETTDDFGAMGSLPTHPELLDHLARGFAEQGWSTKELVRQLMRTDVYARSTTPTESAATIDPKNELLGHMSIRRLEAEEVRDALLAVSGELVPQRFGPPVPIHLTPFMTGRGRPGSSGPLDGDRRRSIYIEVRRNFPHPLLSVFDRPTPSTCHGRRTTANVPAQALALLNDPFVEDRARALAESLDRGDATAAAKELWMRTLGREPTTDERSVAMEHVAGASDVTPWVDLAHTLFNVKEFCFLEARPTP